MLSTGFTLLHLLECLYCGNGGDSSLVIPVEVLVICQQFHLNMALKYLECSSH